MSFDDVTAAPFMVFFVPRENMSADSRKQKNRHKWCSCDVIKGHLSQLAYYVANEINQLPFYVKDYVKEYR